MLRTRKIETCLACGETYGANYLGDRLMSRDLCPCDPKEAEHRRARAEEIAREEEQRRQQELAAVEAEALAKRFQEDATAATECWERKRHVCSRHQNDLFDACHACPRFLRLS